MKTAKVLRVKNEAAAHVVIRKGAGKKLFDMYIHGVIIAIVIPKDAEIQVDPPQAVAQANPEEET